MAGIISYGAYIPFNRLQRATISAALESRPGRGERSVASYDEDTITMAVEAARAARHGREEVPIQSLYFATTEPPYQEKLNSAIVHAALDLPASIRALDVTGSVGAGLGTLFAAAEGVAAGNRLVMMSDIRLGAPEGSAEQAGGDGAVAFILGTDNIIAEIEATYSETLTHQAMWRLPGEKFSKVWEERFSLSQIYSPLLSSGGKNVLEKAGLTMSDISAVVVDSPNPRAVGNVAKALGIEPGKMVDAMQATVGHTGAAYAGLMIAGALDAAKPGDRILVLSASDGVDAAILKATDAVADYKNVQTVVEQIESKRNDLGYARYLKWRGILEAERPRRPDPDRPAAPPVFRARHWKFSFVGNECTECGARHLPPQKVCVSCGAVEKMKPLPFSGRRGNVATYTLDHLAYTLQPPMVMAMIDFEGGGRVELEVTDCEPDNVDIGMELEMTFRRFWTADGVHNYFWKARPVR